MSRKLGAIALAMAILVGAMSLKSVVTSGSGTVLTANGPAPIPTKKFPVKGYVAPPAVR
jgi:hypothetical protein